MFGQNSGGGFRIPPTLIIALVMAAFTLFKYYTNSTVNPITGEKQHIAMSPEQEMAMGLQSAPQMIAEMGGEVNGTEADALVKQIGAELVSKSEAGKTEYAKNFNFHLSAFCRGL